ncbi:pyocin activator PrtN family protein [Methylobacterium flocculans]|uniref:pyocin activator PrtN family protein n=1 Tax=Methylobacterium flocculans TaxID=2984843 RepID=UPI0021F39BD3|nr:pyocin activator PrtN family protein [Methylobacterium sp. FF17]
MTKTAFLLIAQYGLRPLIPIEWVARDFFPEITTEKLIRKISAGEIALPLVRIEASQKAAKSVHILDLAKWFDASLEEAREELARRGGKVAGI